MYTNQSARTWRCQRLTDSRIPAFHQSLPEYGVSPLVPLNDLAKELGLGHVFVKDESNRFDLPAFKILGASWAVYRAVAAKVGRPLTTSLKELGSVAKEKGVKLVTCTEGNWGRATARMGKYFGVHTTVYVPRYMDEATQEKIRGEGAEVVVLSGEYDDALDVARAHSEKTGDLLVLDTSWDGYTDIPGVGLFFPLFMPS